MIIYHLDKTKLFFPLFVSSYKYHVISLNIKTSGSCDNIVLNGNTCQHLGYYQNEIQTNNLYTQCISNYKNNDKILLQMNGWIKGLVFTNINHTILNQIIIKLYMNQIFIFNKQDIQVLSNNTILIKFDNDINTCCFDQFYITLNFNKNNKINDFIIGAYTHNIFSVLTKSNIMIDQGFKYCLN